jgi:hypothetical protein
VSAGNAARFIFDDNFDDCEHKEGAEGEGQIE